MIFTLKMPVLLTAGQKTISSPKADRSWAPHSRAGNNIPKLGQDAKDSKCCCTSIPSKGDSRDRAGSSLLGTDTS